MEPFPCPSNAHPCNEPGSTCRETRNEYKCEEVREPGDEIAALEVARQSLPGKWRRAEEAEQEAAVGRQVLDRGAAKLVEL